MFNIKQKLFMVQKSRVIPINKFSDYFSHANNLSPLIVCESIVDLSQNNYILMTLLKASIGYLQSIQSIINFTYSTLLRIEV